VFTQYGSMNFSIHPLADRFTNWRYDWEKHYVEEMKDLVFKNTFADIEYILCHVGEGGTRSNSNATMSAIFIISPTLSIETLSNRLSSFSAVSESSADSVRTRKISSSCDRRRTGYSDEMPISSRYLAQDVIKCHS